MIPEELLWLCAVLISSVVLGLGSVGQQKEGFEPVLALLRRLVDGPGPEDTWWFFLHPEVQCSILQVSLSLQP